MKQIPSFDHQVFIQKYQTLYIVMNDFVRSTSYANNKDKHANIFKQVFC